jgi:hypothetical protein
MISSKKKEASWVFKLIPAEVESVVREGGGGEEGSESSSQVQDQ